MIEFNGRIMSVPEWSKETGIEKSAIHARLRRGWSVADALTVPTYEGRLVTHEDRTQNVSAWAKEVGIDRATLLYRLNSGWTVHQALTIPLSQKGRKRTNQQKDVDALYRNVEGMIDAMKLDVFNSLLGLIEAQMKTSQVAEQAGKKALAQLEARTRLPPGVVADLTKNAQHRTSPSTQDSM